MRVRIFDQDLIDAVAKRASANKQSVTETVLDVLFDAFDVDDVTRTRKSNPHATNNHAKGVHRDHEQQTQLQQINT